MCLLNFDEPCNTMKCTMAMNVHVAEMDFNVQLFIKTVVESRLLYRHGRQFYFR